MSNKKQCSCDIPFDDCPYAMIYPCRDKWYCTLPKPKEEMEKYKWVHYPSSECPVCGSEAAEVFTRSKKQGFVYDGEAAKCENCGHTGYISVEDSECADVIWDNEDDDQPVTDF